MDGVWADFDQHFLDLYGTPAKEYEKKFGQVKFWELIYETPNFFLEMPPMEYMNDILSACRTVTSRLVILSSPSKTNRPLCMMQKREWVNRHIGYNFPAIFESDKHKYAGPGRLLIDDTKSKCDKWAEAGGDAYLYTNIDLFENFISTL